MQRQQVCKRFSQKSEHFLFFLPIKKIESKKQRDCSCEQSLFGLSGGN